MKDGVGQVTRVLFDCIVFTSLFPLPHTERNCVCVCVCRKCELSGLYESDRARLVVRQIPLQSIHCTLFFRFFILSYMDAEMIERARERESVCVWCGVVLMVMENGKGVDFCAVHLE